MLFWGILGALVMRAILIALGAALIHRFHCVIYLFGAFLIFTGIKFLPTRSRCADLESNRWSCLARRFFPVDRRYEGQTPLREAERRAVHDAADAGPDPDREHRPRLRGRLDPGDLCGHRTIRSSSSRRTSSRSSACGRSTSCWPGYLAGLKYLKPGLAGVLSFVGAKMLLVDVYKIHPFVSLAVIIAILSVAFVASVRAGTLDQSAGISGWSTRTPHRTDWQAYDVEWRRRISRCGASFARLPAHREGSTGWTPPSFMLSITWLATTTRSMTGRVRFQLRDRLSDADDSGGVVLAGLASERDQRQWGGIAATIAASLALAINQGIIRVWDRPRPFEAHQVVLLLKPSADPSFPSDHSTFAFAVAVALFLAWRRLGIAALVVAVLISLSRVYAGEHYVGDVVAGAGSGRSWPWPCTSCGRWRRR